MVRELTSQKKPSVGDTVRISSNLRSIFAGKEGVVTQVRVRKDGLWTAAEVRINDERRWFPKGVLETVEAQRLPPSPPRGDFVRIERRQRSGRQAIALHLYVGRALLARWQAVAGTVTRVDIQLQNDKLAIHAVADGPYVLDAGQYRQPRIHCDGARNIITLADGRYTAQIEGTSLIVSEPLA